MLINIFSKMEDPHKRSKDEAITISLIHDSINKNTPSGIKIKKEFEKTFPLEPVFISTVESGADRSTHHDLQIKINEQIYKTVEVKSSKHFKTIDITKPPWHNGVQFYNGTGSKFSIGQKYARCFYMTMMDDIIKDLDIKTIKPSFEEWVKDAFRQGLPSTIFCKELREKGYKSKYLSDCRKKFNKIFEETLVNGSDLGILMKEVQKIADDTLSCKDYWLQIHGNIDDPEKFHVKWTGKIKMPQIHEVEQIKTKNCCDINFKFICEDNSEFSAKLRWGYGQCITNIRVDIK